MPPKNQGRSKAAQGNASNKTKPATPRNRPKNRKQLNPNLPWVWTNDEGQQVSYSCGSCKTLRSKCSLDCLFAPFFHPEDTLSWAHCQQLYGISNISRLATNVGANERASHVESLKYEAMARNFDPIYGTTAAIGALYALWCRVNDDKKIIAGNFQALYSFLKSKLGDGADDVINRYYEKALQA